MGDGEIEGVGVGAGTGAIVGEAVGDGRGVAVALGIGEGVGVVEIEGLGAGGVAVALTEGFGEMIGVLDGRGEGAGVDPKLESLPLSTLEESVTIGFPHDVIRIQNETRRPLDQSMDSASDPWSKD